MQERTMTDKQGDVQKQHELEQHEVGQVLEFLKRYGMLIGAGVLAAAVVVMASRGIAAHKAAKLMEAEQMLAQARTPQQIEDVVKNYKSTPTAPAALLDLAKTLFNDGDYEGARAQYERFLQDYKNSTLRPIAEFGLAHCTEADGRFDAAADEFKVFLTRHPDSYLKAPAILAAARCLEQSGQLDESRILLEDFLAENANSLWSGAAEAALQGLGN
jgi:TolA-binding protein